MLAYEIKEVLGEGGFGTVYRATVQGEGGFTKEVAIKILNSKMQEMEEVAQRLRDEARMLGLLNHSAIVQVYDLVRLADRWAIVMEYVKGADLATFVLMPSAIPVGPALECAKEIAAALHDAYGTVVDGDCLELLHRDLKPGAIRIWG